MIVKDAKAIVRQWIMAEAAAAPGFAGAFYHGSINWLADDDVLPATSDVDVMVVHADATLPHKLGKFIYRDVLLEVSYMSLDELPSADVILGRYHMAGSFHGPSIIADPSGRLTELQEAVAKDYAKRRWVIARCEDARDKILDRLQIADTFTVFPEQVLATIFPTGVTTLVLLVAGLKNPTVRRRYVAVRELLAEYGRLEFHESLLQLAGYAQLSRARVEQHLAALIEVFDATKAVVKSPFFFASDISDLARPIAIDGTRNLIEQGYHREAVFWIVATYSRCQLILHHDAPADMQQKFFPAYRQLLTDIGITSPADLHHRSEQVKAFLPQLWAVAESILAANLHIESEQTG